MRKIGVYIHWPFCESKCPYCDFNSHVSDSIIDQEAWGVAYIRQLDYMISRIDVNQYVVKSIFFGGGTPSLMQASVVEKIIKFIKENLSCDQLMEVSIEANPSSSEYTKFENFKSAGVNRLSIGVQSLRDDNLKWLGRHHNVEDAIKAVSVARGIFQNYSIDLISCLKDQNVSLWEQELLDAIVMVGDHISVYTLTIEDGTRFASLYNKGRLDIPLDIESEEIFLKTQNVLMSHGFKRYEVSNYARNGAESVHNMLYWQSEDYIGVGPGAVGRCFLKNGERFETLSIKNPKTWRSAVFNEGGGVEFNKIDKETQKKEVLLMGLRTIHGIDIEEINKRFNICLIDGGMQNRIDSLVNKGLVLYDGKTLRPTNCGLNVLNKILLDLVLDWD